MRSSKKRSRSNQNRPRTLGNIVNRVFDSSGPEGKVRGTPQQIIEKYQALARDAQLSNDRVAAENFLQHAEHYTRMLAEAQRELAAEQEARQQQYQQNGHHQNGNRENGNREFRDRNDRPNDRPNDRSGERAERDRDRSDQNRPQSQGHGANAAEAGAQDVIDFGSTDASLVDLPEAGSEARPEARSEVRAEPRPTQNPASAPISSEAAAGDETPSPRENRRADGSKPARSPRGERPARSPRKPAGEAAASEAAEAPAAAEAPEAAAEAAPAAKPRRAPRPRKSDEAAPVAGDASGSPADAG